MCIKIYFFCEYVTSKNQYKEKQGVVFGFGRAFKRCQELIVRHYFQESSFILNRAQIPKFRPQPQKTFWAKIIDYHIFTNTMNENCMNVTMNY